jgi:hypothetical protein
LLAQVKPELLDALQASRKKLNLACHCFVSHLPGALSSPDIVAGILA